MQSKANEICTKHFLSVFLNKTVIELSNRCDVKETSSSTEHTNFALKNFSLSGNMSDVVLKITEAFPFDGEFAKVSRLLLEIIKGNENLTTHFRKFYKSVG
jgi:hypothetical protein